MDYGWLSLIPPAIAIVLAILTRRVIVSLFVAIVLGVLLLNIYQPAVGRWDTSRISHVPYELLGDHLWYSITGDGTLDPLSAAAAIFRGDTESAMQSCDALASSDHLRVCYFTLLFGALVGILHAAGGLRSLVLKLSQKFSSRRGGQILVWLAGLVVFFDDYANTLLVGSTMQGTADRLKFSRAKLAYIVDSTAAPIAGLSLVSTWVATEISYMADGLAAVPNGDASLSAFDLFLASIPYRFYPIFALVMVGIIAWCGRDFGPMLYHESMALGNDSENDSEDADDQWAPGWTAITALAIAMVAIFVVLYRTGSADSNGKGLLQYWGEYVGNADPYSALIWGGICGVLSALLLSLFGGRQPVQKLLVGGFVGAGNLIPALLILILAWTLSRITTADFLNTQEFIGNWIGNEGVPVSMIPTVVFLLSGLVAFSTGTSWGTMGLLVPLAISVCSAAAPDLLPVTTGAVLAGAIFGDHCSPISDTTVLSSQASGCDHIDHVQTQMPYALVAGGVAVVIGTLPASFGVSAWILLPIGMLAIFGIVYLAGKVPTPLDQESREDK